MSGEFRAPCSRARRFVDATMATKILGLPVPPNWLFHSAKLPIANDLVEPFATADVGEHVLCELYRGGQAI